MAQELTPAQLERLKQQRAQKFKEMGLPANAGQIIDIPVENVVEQRVYKAPVQVTDVQVQQYKEPIQQTTFDTSSEVDMSQQILNQLQEEKPQRQNAIYTAPRDKFNALEAIRKGAKKQEFSTFIKAESRGTLENQLPEPKVGKKKQTRNGQLQEKSSNAVEPKAFNAPRSEEADSLESMFTDKATGINIRSSNNLAPQGNLIQTDENYSNIGPTFDPVEHLRKKASERGIDINLTQKQQQVPQVFQTENSTQMSQFLTMMESMMKNQQKNSSNDLPKLKEMMESIAKKTAEDTIRKVLNEYAESQKKKKLFEVVNKEQNVVKIDGKYFQLKPVVPKS